MEYAIVTILVKNHKYDLELPRFMVISELQDKVLGLFKQQFQELFSDVFKIRFLYDGKALNEDKTLDYYQICSGNIIETIVK